MNKKRVESARERARRRGRELMEITSAAMEALPDGVTLILTVQKGLTTVEILGDDPPNSIAETAERLKILAESAVNWRPLEPIN